MFGNQAPRLVELFGIKVEADLAGHMLYVVNEDAPGFIGRLGSTLGEAGVNIGTFHLGRRAGGGRGGAAAQRRRSGHARADRDRPGVAGRADRARALVLMAERDTLA